MSSQLNSLAKKATKWSLLTEISVKAVSPVTQLILARLLAPEAFGMIATITMVTSFAEMLADSGFQKYLVQHEFVDDDDLYKNATVAFWSNMFVSLLMWFVIFLFRDPLVSLVGNPGLGLPLVVASTSLPLMAFTSIQLALYRRALNFKQLFPIRTVVALAPLIVTVPLAIWGWGFWALIFGTLCGNFVNAIALTVMSPWKPSCFYSFFMLKKMFSFSGWSLLEAISIWLTSWAGTFIVGSVLNERYLGLYKQPMTFVNSAFSLVTNATTPILFSTLSRLQGNIEEFKTFFFKFQYAVGMFALPLGAGIFFFRDFLTSVLLGNQWSEAALMFGLWGLSTSIMIPFSHYCSEIYRALGKPRVSLLAQCVYIATMIPTLYFAAQHSFESLVVLNAAIRIVLLASNQVLCFIVARVSIIQMLKNLRTPIISTIVMSCFAYSMTTSFGNEFLATALSMVGCVLVYLACCCLFKDGRGFLLKMKRRNLRKQ